MINIDIFDKKQISLKSHDENIKVPSKYWDIENKCYLYPVKQYNKIIQKFPLAKYSDKFLRIVNKKDNKLLLQKYPPDEKVNNSIKKYFHTELKPFQITGVGFLYDKLVNDIGHSVILADEQGLGKTVESLCTIVKMKYEINLRNVLIVVPNSVKETWLEMIEKFTNESFTLIDKNNYSSQRTFFNVITYDQARILDKDLDKTRYEMVVIDEFHMLKNREAKRTQVILNLKPIYTLFMSGTPILNKIDELWTILNYIEPKEYANYNRFYYRYMVTKTIVVHDWRYGKYYGERAINVVVGAKNVMELRQKIQPFMIRRIKKEVLKELPPKVYQNYYVNLVGKQLKLYNDVSKELFIQLQKNMITLKGALSKFLKLRQIAQTTGFFTEKDVSGKLDLMEQLVGDILSGNNKIFITALYKKTCECAVKRLQKYNPVYVDGSTKKADIIERRKKFIEDPKCKVYIGTVMKHQLGINELTVANYIMFLGKCDVPKLNLQTEDRLHRIGQKKQVTVINIITRNTVEQKIEENLIKKDILFDSLIDGKINYSLGSIKKMIK